MVILILVSILSSHSRIEQRALRASSLRAVVARRRAVRDQQRGRHGAAVAGHAGPRVRAVEALGRRGARHQRVQGGLRQLTGPRLPAGNCAQSAIGAKTFKIGPIVPERTIYKF